MLPANTHNAPTVSVIIPTHNRLQTLKIAVASVLKQTYPVLEIIVIDDGSTDGTDHWLQQHSAPVSFIKQTNQGVSHARNRGIEIAAGDWIALLDSDDAWHTDKLAKQMQALAQAPGSRLCHCDEIWIRNGKRVNPKHKHRKHGGDIFEKCLPLCAISPSAAVIHHTIFHDVGLFDESLPACEDYDLWLRITAHEPVTYIDELLLTKTGGHEDQLSTQFPIMDQFRLQALAKLLRSNKLNAQQYQLAHQVFFSKLQIVTNGARKHQNDKLVQRLAIDYADVPSAAPIDMFAPDIRTL